LFADQYHRDRTTTTTEADDSQHSKDTAITSSHDTSMTSVVQEDDNATRRNFALLNDSVEQQRNKKFRFHLRPDQYALIKPTVQYNKLRNPWTDVIYSEFHKHWPECALIFKYNRCTVDKSRKRGNYWNGAAVCKADSRCIKVSFTITDKPLEGHGVDIMVAVVGDCTHQNQHDVQLLQPTSTNRRFLARDERRKVAETLHKTLHTPASLYAKKLSTMNESELEAGNTTTCQTKPVYRQTLCEYESKKRLHVDPVTELDIMRDAWNVSMAGKRGVDGYIQGIGVYPFYVVFYCESQVQAYVNVCRDKDSVMHLDSTGNVINAIQGQKRPFYYCLYNAESKMPACEFVTTRHNATWLCAMLEMFNEDAKLLNGRRATKPRHIVIDFSYALLYCSLYAFNKMTLVEYLRFSYNVLRGRLTQGEITSKTFINLCKSHLSHSVSSRLTRTERDKKIRRATLLFFTLLQRTTNLQSAADIYGNIYVLLCSQHDNASVLKSLDSLRQCIGNVIPDKHDVMKVLSEVTTKPDDKLPHTDDVLHESDASLKQLSPFTGYFKRKLPQLTTDTDSNDAQCNNLYSPKLFDIIKDVIHLYPLWGASLHMEPQRFSRDNAKKQDVTVKTGCLSNAIIESHFRSVKHSSKVQNNKTSDSNLVQMFWFLREKHEKSNVR